MNDISLDQVNRLVLCKQHLAVKSRTQDIVQIVRDIGGLHATNSTTPYLSLLARIMNFKKDCLDEELYVKRSLGKIRCIRGTLYILAKEMIPMAFAATKKMVEILSRRYAEFQGVPYEKYEEVSKSILKILEGREMSASEIKKALRIQLNVSSILNLLCDQGLLARSQPRRYSLFCEYFPDVDLAKMDETEAITQLVRYYLTAFGPVTESDITWWTGLNKAGVQKALSNIQEQTVKVEISGLSGNFIMLRSDESLVRTQAFSQEQTINLLPSLDPYLMGYKERKRYLDHEHYCEVFDRSGNATSAILIDGRVAGVWDFTENSKPSVKLLLFEEIGADVLDKIYSEAQRVGEFMAGKEVQIKECRSMVPLTHRTAGGVMSPLKGC